MKRYERILEEVRDAFVPDVRSGVFDLRIEDRDGTVVVSGQSTHPEAVGKVLELLQRRLRGRSIVNETVGLPDAALAAGPAALVSAAIAPVYSEPRLPAPQISQLVAGMRVDVLARTDAWLRVRGEDGYIGWVHEGYLELGTREWAEAWERASGGEPVVSLGAELVDADQRPLMRLPWGARLLRRGGLYIAPGGREGQVAGGDVVDVDRLADWFPARGESIARTTRRWLGAPYLWGGVTPQGVDCSGFTQAVMWMHGVALPRDSDLQARVGSPIDVSADLQALRPGDLVFFAEPGRRISHVAIVAAGTEVIHSALGNGGVAIDDLAGSRLFERNLRSLLVQAQRLLPD